MTVSDILSFICTSNHEIEITKQTIVACHAQYILGLISIRLLGLRNQLILFRLPHHLLKGGMPTPPLT